MGNQMKTIYPIDPIDLPESLVNWTWQRMMDKTELCIYEYGCYYATTKLQDELTIQFLKYSLN